MVGRSLRIGVVAYTQSQQHTLRTLVEECGHQVEALAPWAGGGAVQLIQFDHARGVLRGASDSRPGGLALGF